MCMNDRCRIIVIIIIHLWQKKKKRAKWEHLIFEKENKHYQSQEQESHIEKEKSFVSKYENKVDQVY